jgi:hypothetical protein
MYCPVDVVSVGGGVQTMQDGFEASSFSPQSEVDYRPSSLNDHPDAGGYEAMYSSGHGVDSVGAKGAPQDAEKQDATGGGNFGGFNGIRKPKTCFRCGGTGHISSICPTKPDFVASHDSPRCYSCNGV